MKKIFDNFKPFICYSISCLTYIVLAFFEIASFSVASACSVIVFFISFMLLGYYNSIKQYIWGYILFELMLILCAWSYINTLPGAELGVIVPLGNIIYWNYLEFIKSDYISLIVSVIMPAIPISIGFIIYKLSKKASNRWWNW